MKKLLIWISLIILLLGALASVAFYMIQSDDEQEGYRVYYLSQEEDQLVPDYCEAEESEPSALIAELYLLQQSLPEKNKENLKLLLPENVLLMNFSLEEGVLTLDFSSDYTKMTGEREILVRAGMVRLFSQVPEVKKVLFLVNGEPLKLSDGTEIGSMTTGRFVENSGKEINSYLKTSMTLYFTDAEGRQLVPEERSVYYNSNVPLEKVVVEQLVKGPKEDGHMPTLPPELNILSVTIQDEICYVNLDDSFKTLLEISTSTLNPELAVYSIATSLAHVCQVKKIQISVNGKTNIEVGSVDLSNLITERSDLIKSEDTVEDIETSEETEDSVEEQSAASAE